MRYALSRYRREAEDKAYRVYITDALKVLTGNTANYAGGSVMSGRYADLWKPADTRSAEEVAADVIKKAGLVVKT